MKIDAYTIEMSSSSFSAKATSITEKTTVATQSLLANPQVQALFNQNPNQSNPAALLTLSQEAQEQFLQNQQQQQEQNAAQNQTDLVQSAQDKLGGLTANLPDKYQLKLKLLESLMSTLTGRPFKFSSILDNLQNRQQQQQQPIVAQPIEVMQVSATREVTQTVHEQQSMSFAAQGIVHTSDGRRITFDMSVLANYEFSSSSSVKENVQLQLADPLVINFDGTLPEFTKDRYEFDITINGALENIFMPTNGSGFLALDKNGNGAIDDGSELFGAQTGDGFYELMAYDDDGNGWIDENDAVFGELKIMSVDKSTGEKMLVSLKDSGVGAIFLGSTKAHYEIKADNNETAGIVRKNGIFLNENGTPGTIHHIDLTY